MKHKIAADPAAGRLRCDCHTRDVVHSHSRSCRFTPFKVSLKRPHCALLSKQSCAGSHRSLAARRTFCTSEREAHIQGPRKPVIFTFSCKAATSCFLRPKGGGEPQGVVPPLGVVPEVQAKHPLTRAQAPSRGGRSGGDISKQQAGGWTHSFFLS